MTQVTPESNLASRAKDLRGMTERRFAEVIEGWRRQNDALQQELDMYQNQQRISSERYVYFTNLVHIKRQSLEALELRTYLRTVVICNHDFNLALEYRRETQR